MSKAILRHCIDGDNQYDMLWFWCPGCNEHHALRIDRGWNWDKSEDSPTVTPSILVRSLKLTEKGMAQYDAWIGAGCPKTGEKFDSVDTVCHSFITDGKIQFLSDCTHALAGQNVDLPEMEV